MLEVSKEILGIGMHQEQTARAMIYLHQNRGSYCRTVAATLLISLWASLGFSQCYLVKYQTVEDFNLLEEELVRSLNDRVVKQYDLLFNPHEASVGVSHYYIESLSGNRKTLFVPSLVFWRLGQDSIDLFAGAYESGNWERRPLGTVYELDKWKKTDKKDSMLGFRVEEAIYEGPVSTATAWYTTEIPLPVGPTSSAFRLPGLVLSFTDLTGDVYVAVSVEVSDGCTFDQPPKQKAAGRTLGYRELKMMPDRAIYLDANSPKGQWIEVDRSYIYKCCEASED